MVMWAEHFRELHEKGNSVSQAAIQCITPLLIMDEVDVTTTFEELNKVTDSVNCGKDLGNDGIRSKVLLAGEATLVLH